MCRPMCCTENHPWKVGAIASVLVECLLILPNGGQVGFLRANNHLACNGMLRDTHIKYVHFEKWKTNA